VQLTQLVCVDSHASCNRVNDFIRVFLLRLH
jgi:hypothetical protein